MIVGAMLPDDVQADLEAELAGLSNAESAKGVSADYLRFMAMAARGRARTRASIREAGLGPRVSEGEDPGRFLTAGDVGLDEDILRGFLRELEDAVTGEGSASQLPSLSRAVNDGKCSLEKIVEAAAPGGDARALGEAANETGIPAHALLLIGRLLASPFFEEARPSRGDASEIDTRAPADNGSGIKEAALPGRCPSCGSGAALAALRRDDGVRRLMCGLCKQTWLAPRVMCTFCGEREQSKLATLSVAEGDARWVEVCDSCRRYVKTVDERLLPEHYGVVVGAEDARTLYLDMMAESEGYVRSAF